MRKFIYKILLIFICCCSVLSSYGAPSRNAKVARVGATQKVLDIGTKVEASKSTSSACQDKYDACMDTGCIIDNAPGGRCQCGEKIKELSDIEKKLKIKDMQSQKMLTEGVDFVENGSDDEDINVQVDTSDFDMDVSEGVVGEALRQEMHELCVEKIPECKSQISLVKNIYLQKIKSDCAGFENALREQNFATKDNRAAAKKAVRTAALDNYQNANKYDLGECTIKFTECMQTTAECGENWTGCVGSVAQDSIKESVYDKIAVRGQKSSVLIAKSTMEVLEAKKIICEGITKSCEAVKDDVWDAFLQNSIVDIKIAESLSESNLRTSCLTNISNCFVKACKDNINEKEPDSYDMCLTRPETVKSLCRVEMEPCLNATGGTLDNPDKSSLWPSVLAKLSAMRVDACTDEVQKCLQSEDRCGEDYSKCVGLDTNIIVHMCPYDKLTGCQKIYGREAILKDENIYENIAQLIEGTILNIDNNMLNTCENAIDTAMAKVCGDKDSCAKFVTSEGATGAGSLRYRVCQYKTDSPDSTEGFDYFDCRADINLISDAELGRDKHSKTGDLGTVLPFAGVISGTIRWESITVDDNGYIDAKEYLEELEKEGKTGEKAEEVERIKSEIQLLQDSINRVLSLIENDYTVQYCINGRETPGITDMFKTNKARFPNLGAASRKIIAAAALKQAKDNYYALYDQYAEKMQQDYATISGRIRQNERDNQDDIKKEACVNLAAVSVFAKAPVGQDLFAKIMIGIIVVAALVVACVFTAGGATGAIAGITAFTTTTTSTISGTIAGSAIGAAISIAPITVTTTISMTAFTGAITAGVAATAGAVAIGGMTAAVTDGLQGVHEREANVYNEKHESRNTDTHGEFYDNQWNYQEKITTDFDVDTHICKKCVAAKKCNKPKWHLFSDRSCADWDEFKESHCTEIQF